MRTFPVAILSVLLLACGEPAPPEAPAPQAETLPAPETLQAPPAGVAPEPAPLPTPPPAPVQKPPAAAKPTPVVASPRPTPAAPPPEAAPEPAPQPAPALDLDSLERRLKETSALGVLTKLALKNEIDDLIDDVGRFHKKQRSELAALRERFELLLMKVTSLLQDKEPDLAREIAGAREGLWKLLADPGEFAKLTA